LEIILIFSLYIKSIKIGNATDVKGRI
jgi:hypothetical protein